MSKDTLNNAILLSLRELNKPSTSKEVCQHILLNSYYEFGSAKTPCSTVSALLGNFVRANKENVQRKYIKKVLYYYLDNIEYPSKNIETKKRKNKSIWKAENLQLLENQIEIIDNNYSIQEGKSKYRRHLVRERKSKVVKLAKAKFKKEQGRLYCEVCGFDFEKAYGKIGEDFIEGHHNIPISELKENQETKIEDISLVCSNCHKMLHRRKPWLKVEELKELIK